MVYGYRLGNTGPDYGWLYLERGLVQITGKAILRQEATVVAPDHLRRILYRVTACS
ncbi:hypothetical protein ACIQUG_15120 [Ensifer sp. NPDC090286]|uniref:hypothetical protein n=1 Tax=Ensifer sp. NPDC090286 TaxID=3363991 RepID=UPI00383ADC47